MTKFVKAVVDMVIENDFDGVEIEYVLSPFSETSN